MRQPGAWIAGTAIVLLAALLGARPVTGQQQGRVAVAARVAPLTVAVSPETLRALLPHPPERQSGGTDYPAPPSVTGPSRLFTVQATRRCSGTRDPECILLLTVQLLAN